MTGQPPNLAKLTPVIELRGVAKHYQDKPALHALNLSVRSGECFALLGHNGAGKTTLIKLICGLTKPSQGAIYWQGQPLQDAKHWRRQIGYMPENAAFQGTMSGREILRFYARLKNCPLAQCEDLLAQVGLAEATCQKISTYSKGMRQRLLLAQALLGNPSLLLLDEPTSGLDPALRAEFYRLLRQRLDAGVTVLISSHALAELESQADRVAILQQGKLLACGTPDELRQQTDLPVRMRLSLPRESVEQALTLCQRAGIKAQWGGAWLELVCSKTQKMPLLRQLTQLGEALEDIEIQSPTLDQIYAHINNGTTTEASPMEAPP